MSRFDQIVGERRRHGRHGEKERELRRRRPIETDRETADNRRSGSRHAGNQRQHLKDADRNRAGQRNAIHLADVRPGPHPLDQQHHDPAENEGGGNRTEAVIQDGSDELREQSAGDQRRDGRGDDRQGKGARLRVAAQAGLNDAEKRRLERVRQITTPASCVAVFAGVLAAAARRRPRSPGRGRRRGSDRCRARSSRSRRR